MPTHLVVAYLRPIWRSHRKICGAEEANPHCALIPGLGGPYRGVRCKYGRIGQTRQHDPADGPMRPRRGCWWVALAEPASFAPHRANYQVAP